MRTAVLFSVSVLLFGLVSPSVAALETIGSGTSRTVTLAMYSHDAYELETSGGNTASIELTAGSTVDFYVMTASGYAEYTDPNAPSFGVVDDRENAQSFAYSTTQSGLIFVVDNDDISSSGASSTGSVTYVLTVVFAAPPSDGGPTTTSIILAIVAAAAVFSAIAATVYMRRRRTTQSASLVQPVSPPQASGISPPSVVSTAPTWPVEQAPGTMRRPLSAVEQDMLIRDFAKQRARFVGGSIVGLGLAIAYNVFPNLMTLSLSIVAFLAPAIAYGLVKLRRAILAGQVVEFHGVPALLETNRAGKQQFYRVQFGTESVLVSSSLWSRLVPNQPNSLTVLEGANLAIGLNGVPLPNTERVRLATRTTSLAG